MELTDLSELHQPIFRKMVEMKEARLFGNPDTMAMHMGRGYEKFAYQSVTIDGDRKKLSFAALCRFIAFVHDLDWAVLTMDALISHYDGKDVPIEEAIRLGSSKLERMGLVQRKSAIVSIATSRSGHTHILRALENDDQTYTIDPTPEYKPDGLIGIATGQDLLIFGNPTHRMLCALREIMENQEAVELAKSVPFQNAKYV